MKNIQLLLLIILMQTSFVQAAQESKSDNDSDAESVQSFKRRRLDSDSCLQSVVVIPFIKLATPGVDQERQDFINSLVENYSVLDQGLKLLRKQGKKIERLDRFMDKNLEIDADDQSVEINQGRVDFGTMIEQAQDLLMTEMRDPFLQSLNDAIISSNNDINERIKSSNSSILRYVMRYKNEKLEPMVKQWVNHQDDFGVTLLHKSVLTGDLEAVDFLISLGADPNIQDNDGQTVLHIAPVHMIKMLADLGANLNIQDNYGCTAICRAYKNNKIDLFTVLYQLGADPIIVDDEGIFNFTPSNTYFIDPLNDLKFTDIIYEYYERYADVLEAKYLKNWELRQAILDQNIPLIKKLIKQGADIDFVPMRFSFLKARGPKMIMANYATNLSLAVAFNIDIKILKILLESGARVNKQSQYTNETPLHYAVERLNREAVQILLEYKADPCIVETSCYRTPMHIAVDSFYGLHSNQMHNYINIQQEIIKLLLVHGAAESLTVLDECNWETPLMSVVDNNRADLLRLFLEYKPDINYFDLDISIDDGDAMDAETLLHRAARHNHIDIARLLLAQSDSDTSILNLQGQTAFDVATTDEMRALLQS